jgi:hypothetical protein
MGKIKGNPVPSLNNILEECKDLILFHIGSTFSDTDEVENNLIKKIKTYQNGVETDNEQPKFLVMHTNYPMAFCSDKKKFLEREKEEDIEHMEFIPIKLGDIKD